MPSGVSCSVSNCTFWDEGNRCGAKEIMIEVDEHASESWDDEVADEFFIHEDRALTSSVTCCLTFQPKSKS